MRMIGIPAEDDHGVAVMIAAGPGALLLTVALGGLRALESEFLATSTPFKEYKTLKFTKNIII